MPQGKIKAEKRNKVNRGILCEGVRVPVNSLLFQQNPDRTERASHGGILRRVTQAGEERKKKKAEYKRFFQDASVDGQNEGTREAKEKLRHEIMAGLGELMVFSFCLPSFQVKFF